METAAQRIESIEVTITRMRKDIKALTLKKKKLEKELVEGMRRKRVTQYRQFTLEKLDPPKKPRRKPKETEREIIRTLTGLGVADPITAAAKLKAVTARRPPAPTAKP